jgi:SnoaL-like protein
MADVTATVEGYIDSWNETDPDRRRAIIARVWTEDASHVDPLAAGEGHEGIDALVAGVQERLPGTRFSLAGAPDRHHDRVRFTWHLTAAAGGDPLAVGIDFGTVAADGRLRAVTGFLEPVA